MHLWSCDLRRFWSTLYLHACQVIVITIHRWFRCLSVPCYVGCQSNAVNPVCIERTSTSKNWLPHTFVDCMEPWGWYVDECSIIFISSCHLTGAEVGVVLECMEPWRWYVDECSIICWLYASMGMMCWWVEHHLHVFLRVLRLVWSWSVSNYLDGVWMSAASSSCLLTGAEADVVLECMEPWGWCVDECSIIFVSSCRCWGWCGPGVYGTMWMMCGWMWHHLCVFLQVLKMVWSQSLRGWLQNWRLFQVPRVGVACPWWWVPERLTLTLKHYQRASVTIIIVTTGHYGWVSGKCVLCVNIHLFSTTFTPC